MHYPYAILGFPILALASPIRMHSPRVVVASLDRTSTGKTVNGIVGGRDRSIAPQFVAVQAPPKATSTPSASTTAHDPASSVFPSQAPFSLPQQSRWGPGVISNVLFGCVTSFLGAMAVGVPYYLYRRQLRSQQSGLWTKMDLPVIKVTDSLINRRIS